MNSRLIGFLNEQVKSLSSKAAYHYTIPTNNHAGKNGKIINQHKETAAILSSNTGTNTGICTKINMRYRF